MGPLRLPNFVCFLQAPYTTDGMEQEKQAVLPLVCNMGSSSECNHSSGTSLLNISGSFPGLVVHCVYTMYTIWLGW